MVLIKRLSLIILISFFISGCPDVGTKINGVYSMGEKEYSKEEISIAQVYYYVPLQSFYPAEFKIDFLEGHAALTIWKHEALSEVVLAYDFDFTMNDIKQDKDGDKKVYRAKLRSTQDPQVFLEAVVKDYKAKLDDAKKTFYFDRRDMDLVLTTNQKILGRFHGAKMDFTHWQQNSLRPAATN